MVVKKFEDYVYEESDGNLCVPSLREHCFDSM